MSKIDPLAIAQALIRCPSVTPAEGGALAYLEELLTPHGFTCDRVTFSDPDSPDVENLYARWGTEEPVVRLRRAHRRRAARRRGTLASSAVLRRDR